MAVAIRIKRGTKANIESAKATLKQWEQVYATNTDEIGIYDGSNIRWQSSGGEAPSYATMTQAQVDEGTSTTSMVISPKLIKDNLNTKENLIAVGTTTQYLRGDKTWQTLNKASVGLGNVDNTSDLNKPISTATQTALNNKANTTDVNNGLALKVNIAGNATIAGTKDFTGTLLYDGEEVATIQDLTTVFRYKGSVATYANLPTSGQQIGDVYNVNDTGKNYAWSDTFWDDLGGTVDLSIYATKTELTNGLSGKVDKVAGKQLSTEDFTTAEKTKLSEIEVGAQVNTVVSVAGKTGSVVLAKGDVGLGNVQNYAIASQSEAEAGTSNDKYMTPLRTKAQGDTYYVPLARTVNSKALSANITLNATDVGARGSTWTPTWSEVSGKPSWIGATKPDYTYAEISGTKPPTNAQKNSDITKAEIEAKLIGSINTHSHSYNDLSDKPTIPSIPSIMTTTEGNTGTATTQRTINAENLKAIILNHSPAGSRPASDVSAWAKASSKPSYTWSEITSKPTFATVATSGSYNDLTNKPTIPTKTSELVNDSGLATETYVNNKVSSVYKYKGSVLTFNNLPTTNRTIGDVYDVQDTGMNYAWSGTEWDSLGTVIDLSNYFQKTETFSQTQVNQLLNNKVDKVAGKGLSTNDFTTAEKTKLSGIATNAQVNVLEGVQLNGTDVAISSKKSNIVVNKTTVGLSNVANVDTTNPANITQSATYRFVTDAEKTTWNGKQNALGFTPENITNKVTTITASSTNTQYPSAKAVYDAINNAIIAGINGGY